MNQLPKAVLAKDKIAVNLRHHAEMMKNGFSSSFAYKKTLGMSHREKLSSLEKAGVKIIR